MSLSPVRPVFDPAHLYFVTTTAANHARFFKRDVIKRIIIESLGYMRHNGWINLYAFVIMPNHVHFISRFHENHALSDVMREFKKHTARQIIRQYQVEDNQTILEAMMKAATNYPGQEYKVWEHGYDARDIYTPGFLRQKLDYVHFNPCQDRWRLVELPEDYIWSSARFYMADKPAVIDVDDVRELFVE